MKLFVTGGTGFLGSHFLKAACSSGHEIVALRRRLDRPCLERTEAPSPAVQWVEGELDRPPTSAFDGVDTLVHFAAAGVSPQTVTWEEAFRCNVSATLALIETAATHGVSRFIVAGTIAEYGRSAQRHETIPPDAPLEPDGPYAASKAAASLALISLARQRQLELAVLRVANLYGEGQHPSNLWMQLKEAARSGKDLDLTLGEQIRDFLPVEAAARTFVDTCSNLPLLPGEPRVLHVCSGIPTTLRLFAKSEWNRLEAKGALRFGAIPYRRDETMRYVPSPTPWQS